jgi:hypothetical protein
VKATGMLQASAATVLTILLFESKEQINKAPITICSSTIYAMDINVYIYSTHHAMHPYPLIEYPGHGSSKHRPSMSLSQVESNGDVAP